MEYITCHDCDLVVELPQLKDGERAYCPRCHHLLTNKIPDPLQRAGAYSIAALILLILANCYPFLTFSAKGHVQVMTLIQSAIALYRDGSEILSFFVVAFIILIPALVLICQQMVILPLLLGREPLINRRLWARAMYMLSPWSMVEVFIVGVLVSLVKIASIATVILGISFWAYVGFTLLFLLAFTSLDRYQLWNILLPHPQPPAQPGRSAISQNLASCHICTLTASADEHRCPRCHAPLHVRIRNSLQNTMAMLITAFILYFPANMFPITRTEQFGNILDSTIIGGVILMWNMGSYAVAMVIFFASVMIPLAKLLALAWLSWSVANADPDKARQRTILYRVTEFVGRWSMIDVFVVSILVALIHLGNVLSIYPGHAALAFSGVVIITILAAEYFDPRLIWDELERKSR